MKREEDIKSLDAAGRLLPVSPCPTCGYNCACASKLTGDEALRPAPGTLVICANCGEMNAYDQLLRLMPCPLSALMSLTREQHWQVEVVQRKIRKRGRYWPDDKESKCS